jgi:hypothetical protein
MVEQVVGRLVDVARHARSLAQVQTWTVLLVAAGVVAALVAGLVPVPEAVQGALGGLGGVAFFVAGAWTWAVLLPGPVTESLDVRSRLPLPVRRTRTMWFAGVWIVAAYLISSALPWTGPVLGAISVALLGAAMVILTMTEEERALAEEEAARAAEEDLWLAQSSPEQAGTPRTGGASGALRRWIGNKLLK